MSVAGHPKERPKRGQTLAAHVDEMKAGDFFSGAIQQKDFAFEVGGEQAAAHGINNVLVERLQILKLAALLFEFGALAAQRLSEAAGKVGYREKGSQICEDPGLQFLRTGSAESGTRQFSVVDQLNHSAKKDETED